MFEIFKKNRTQSTSLAEAGRTPQDIEKTVHTWLTEERFELKNIPDEKACFKYFVTRDRTPTFSIIQPKCKPDSILFESWITFKGVEKEKAVRIFDQSQSILLDLRLHFESKGLLYDIRPPDFYNSRPGAIFFAQPVYFDGVSKDRILQTALTMIHTVGFVALTIQRQLASIQSDSGVPSYLR